MLRAITNVKIYNLLKINNLCQQVKQRGRLKGLRLTLSKRI